MVEPNCHIKQFPFLMSELIVSLRFYNFIIDAQ